MKHLLSLALIVVMGVTFQKERPMSYADQVRARQANAEAAYQERRGNANAAESNRYQAAADRYKQQQQQQQQNAYAARWQGMADRPMNPYRPNNWNMIASGRGGAQQPQTNWNAVANRGMGMPAQEENPFAWKGVAPNPVSQAWQQQQQQAANNPVSQAFQQQQPMQTPAKATMNAPAWLGTQTAARVSSLSPMQQVNMPVREKRQSETAGDVGTARAVEEATAPIRAANASVIDAYNYGLLMQQQGAGGYYTPPTGFGTNYGWGGGGGGGGSWGGGGGYRSAWSPDMGLFQWNYKG